MNIDTLTAGSAIFSFFIFLSVHFITFRRVRPERLLRSLLVCVVALLALPMALMAFFYILQVGQLPLQAWVIAALLSSAIQGLLCFFYVLCIFGPYETSVRMRLVREIARGGPQGISSQELSNRYNTQTIVDLRLQRLVGSGDIVEANGRYRIGHAQNFFFIFDAIAGLIKKGIGK